MRAGSALAIMLLLSTSTARASAPTVPDHIRTPGVADSSITDSNYRTYLCVGNKGKKLHTTDERRPNSGYTSGLKKQQLSDWGYSDKKLGDYEEDHLISLEIGGDPSDPKNLWPEPYKGKWNAHTKDLFEHELGRRICLKPTDQDFVSLQDARSIISGTWSDHFDDIVCKRSLKLSKSMKAACK